MATELSTKTEFEYSSLADPATHIRLLEIVAPPATAPPSDHVQISILTTPLDVAPSYHAVSYTWGDINNQDQITISGLDTHGRMTVRKNCADALRQLAYFSTTRYFWMDAICINQSDDFEKSFQVAMMGDIYRRAERVLACLGMPDDNDHLVSVLLHEFDVYLASHGHSTEIFIFEEWDEEREPFTNECLRVGRRWLERLSDTLTVKLCKALDDFAEHPYFQRVWILQELFLSRRLSIFLGFHELSLPTLLFWWQDSRQLWFFKHPYSVGAEAEVPLYEKLMSTDIGREYTEMALWTDETNFDENGGTALGKAYTSFLRMCAISMKTNHEKNPIYRKDVVMMCETLLCQDRRDTIYGTLALTVWSGSSKHKPRRNNIYAKSSTDCFFKPDYTRSTFDLAKEVLIHFDSASEMWQVISMLRLSQTDKEIMDSIENRRHLPLFADIESDEEVVRLAQRQAQGQAHIFEHFVQLTNEGPVKFERVERYGRTYTRISCENEDYSAVASAGVQLNDWLLCTGIRYGIVLRRNSAESRYYTIVGRIAGSTASYLTASGMTRSSNVWLGIEDMIVHLAQGSALVDDWNVVDGPSERLHAALHLPFCVERCSSFAEVPQA
jgi:hypothetical protein